MIEGRDVYPALRVFGKAVASQKPTHDDSPDPCHRFEGARVKKEEPCKDRARITFWYMREIIHSSQEKLVPIKRPVVSWESSAAFS